MLSQIYAKTKFSRIKSVLQDIKMVGESEELKFH